MEMNDATPTALIGKYLAGNLTEAERVRLMDWVEAAPANRAYLEEMIQLWSVAGQYHVPYKSNTPQAWLALEKRLFSNESATIPSPPLSFEQMPNKPGRLSIRRFALSAAAVILLLISVGIWLFFPFSTPTDRMIVVQTAKDTHRQLELPDGSTIWLNENTRLTYEQSFKNRVLTLEGEAYFEVAHQNGQSFTVLSNGVATVVLGTAFNVRAYAREPRVEVTVHSGKVELRKADAPDEKVQLTSGTSGWFEKPTATISQAEKPISNADAWRNQRLEFNNTPMREVLEAARRYYGVEIEVVNEAILNCPLTSNFEGAAFENFVSTLEFAAPFKVVRKSNGYLITGKGCR